MKERNACIVSIHCFGHRLELGYKESLTKVALGKKVVTLLMGLTTSIKTAHLTAVICKSRLGRQVGHVVRVLTNFFRGYEALLLHLQQLVDGSKVSPTAKCKAKCFPKFLTKRDIMQFSALLHDVVSALRVISQIFQRKDGMAPDIH